MHSPIGGRMLPETAGVSEGASEINLSKLHEADINALITGIRDISEKLQSTAPLIYSGSGDPLAVAPATGGLYIRTNGNSVNTLMINPGGNTWSAVVFA